MIELNDQSRIFIAIYSNVFNQNSINFNWKHKKVFHQNCFEIFQFGFTDGFYDIHVIMRVIEFRYWISWIWFFNPSTFAQRVLQEQNDEVIKLYSSLNNFVSGCGLTNKQIRYITQNIQYILRYPFHNDDFYAF